MKKNIEELKLICEFMGIEVVETYRVNEHVEYRIKSPYVEKWRGDSRFGLVGGIGEYALLNSTQFNTSLDWLFEVVHVITSKSDEVVHKTHVSISENKVTFTADTKNQWKGISAFLIANYEGDNLIDVLYRSVVEYITWYNSGDERRIYRSHLKSPYYIKDSRVTPEREKRFYQEKTLHD